MRAWSVFRQLLVATLCAVLVAPAYPSESTLPRSSSTLSHTYDAATLSKTRVWGSNAKILLHFRAMVLLSEKQHWGCGNSSWKTVVGSGVTYDYDAFGNLLHSTGTTFNEFLFAGEQFDSDLNLYYNRARYLNVSTGRFWTMDRFEGGLFEPLSLHKYLYASADPIDRVDPSGQQDLVSEIAGEADMQIVRGIAIVSAIAALCTVDYALGGDVCIDRNRDRERTFYHGTSAYVAEVIVAEQRVDPEAIEAFGSENSDYGLGFYMSEQLSTARFYANIRGNLGKQGGPGIVEVDISSQHWKRLVLLGAIDTSPVSRLVGQTQVFVPIYLIDLFNALKTRFSLVQ